MISSKWVCKNEKKKNLFLHNHNRIITDTTVKSKHFCEETQINCFTNYQSGEDRLKVQYTPIESLPEHITMTS